ncbi:MAG: alpha/beta hydrolase family protein [Nannocystaceae bacterium]|nr:alpha/beta hydrolase [bacterium]
MRRIAITGLGLLLSACLTPPPSVESTQAPEVGAVAAAQEAAVLWAGVSPAAAYPAGQTRAFEFVQSGRRIGRSWGRYVGPLEEQPTHHRFETRIELELPGRAPLRSSGELILDEQGALVRGFERSDAAELTFVREDDTLRISDGQTEQEVGYDPQTVPTGVMAHSAILHEELLLRLRPLQAGTLELRLLSLSGGIPAQWSGEVRQAQGAVIVETNLGERITLRDGFIESIFVSASELSIETVAEPWPTWEIRGPTRLTYAKPPGATFSRRDVEIPGSKDGPTLAGEVLVPRGEGPHPAVLWVGSTGREDRYGFAGPPPVDLGAHEITDALAQAGFVVLRFDERGRGESEPGPLSFVGQVDDAKRAFGMLLVQPEVDPDRVVLVGHGEGGLRQLTLAANMPQGIVGIALLATPGRPYREVFLEQAAAALAELPPELRAGAATQQQKMVEAVEGGGAVPPELEGEAQWLREMFAVRPAKLFGRLSAPVFVAQGDKDFEVDPDADPIALRRAAKKAKLQVELRRYRDLDHLFKREPGRSMPSRYLEPGRHVDAAFIEDLVAWAKAQAKP